MNKYYNLSGIVFSGAGAAPSTGDGWSGNCAGGVGFPLRPATGESAIPTAERLNPSVGEPVTGFVGRVNAPEKGRNGDKTLPPVAGLVG